jgi:hypothetical protein
MLALSAGVAPSIVGLLWVIVGGLCDELQHCAGGGPPVSHSIVEITGPADEAGGVWECNVMTCIQTNSETKVERHIMRVVVTTSGS